MKEIKDFCYEEINRLKHQEFYSYTYSTGMIYALERVIKKIEEIEIQYSKDNVF